eukprot:808725-Rhodomonas_salina.1
MPPGTVLANVSCFLMGQHVISVSTVEDGADFLFTFRDSAVLRIGQLAPSQGSQSGGLLVVAGIFSVPATVDPASFRAELQFANRSSVALRVISSISLWDWSQQTGRYIS